MPRTSSVMPSAKYSSSARPRFSNGSTATQPGAAGAGSPSPCRWRQAKSTPRPEHEAEGEHHERGRRAGDAGGAGSARPAWPPACHRGRRRDGGSPPRPARARSRPAERQRSAGTAPARGRRRAPPPPAPPAGASGRSAPVAAESLGDHRLRRWPGERRLAGQHLVEHAAERVDVGAGVDVALAARLLGAHVGRRADGEAGLGELARRRPPASARAMPKSATSVWPSAVSRMFSGLMSRCTTPCRWA